MAEAERLPALGQTSVEGGAVREGLTYWCWLGGRVGEGDVVGCFISFGIERLVRDGTGAVVEEDGIFLRIAERGFVLTWREDERRGDGGRGSERVIMVKIVQASKIISVVPLLLHGSELRADGV